MKKVIIHRGVRLGCPLSPLFDIALEPLSLATQAKKNQGCHCSDKEYKVALYADDIVCFLENPLSSMKALRMVISQFSLSSGYKINEDIDEKRLRQI